MMNDGTGRLAAPVYAQVAGMAVAGPVWVVARFHPGSPGDFGVLGAIVQVRRWPRLRAIAAIRGVVRDRARHSFLISY